MNSADLCLLATIQVMTMVSACLYLVNKQDNLFSLGPMKINLPVVTLTHRKCGVVLVCMSVAAQLKV